MNVYETAIDFIDNQQAAALGIVLHTRGSTPQKAGAKALFRPTGSVHGTLGGGCLEAEAQQRALLALDEGAARHFTVNLDEVDGWDDGLICGGRATVFTAPLLPANRSAYASALKAHRDGECGALATVINHPAYPRGTAIWYPMASTLSAGIPETARDKALAQEKPVLAPGADALEDAAVAWFLEPVSPAPRLYIVGAGHIGKALTRYASRVGFSVTVVDDRPAFANVDALPEADAVICGEIGEALGALTLTPRDFVVIVTRGHRHDGLALERCIHHELAYLGLIGSRRKGLLLRNRLLESGHATAEQVSRVVTPMGVDLGGATVEEIALSIAAQLVAVRRKGKLEAPALHDDHIIHFEAVSQP